MDGDGVAITGSATIREEGNTFYKQNRILEGLSEWFAEVPHDVRSSSLMFTSLAIDAYKKALALDPDNPALFSNLSAAYFELGDYTQCVLFTEGALRIIGDDANALTEKLNHRLIKSYFHIGQLDSVREALQKAKLKTEDSQVYRATLDRTRAVCRASPDREWARSRVIDELPRYRPTM